MSLMMFMYIPVEILPTGEVVGVPPGWCPVGSKVVPFALHGKGVVVKWTGKNCSKSSSQRQGKENY